MKRKTGTAYVVAIVCAFVLWFWCGRNVVAEAVYPVENSVGWFQRNVVVPLKGFFTAGLVARENERLRREVSELRMREGEAARLSAENARLRGLLGLDGGDALPKDRWLYAPVIGRGGAAGVRHRIRVRGGSLDGVATNAVAATPDGLVGRVVAVTPRTSTVQLLTDPALMVSCEVARPAEEGGSVFGMVNGGGIRAIRPKQGVPLLCVVNPLGVRHLRRDAEIAPGARVVTSGLGGTYPAGIAVGVLADWTKTDEMQLEREGDVVPAVDFRTLKDVFIRRGK